MDVWRVHNAGRGPWYFGQTQRFSLQGSDGTCHVALDAATAILETVVRGSRAINRDDLTSRRIRRLPLPQDYKLANLTHPRATGWGVTRQFGTDYPYDRCQAWATAFRSEKYGGLQFWANHDVSASGISLALFGKAGERTSWRRGTAERLDDAKWIRQIKDNLGVGILGTHSSSVTFVALGAP